MATLSSANHVPKYIQLKELLEQQIDDGVWSPGEKIPSEAELQQMFGISRTTVRLAIKELIVEQKLVTVQGRGTFVVEPKVENTLPELTSFTEDIQEKGFQPGSTVLSVTREQASDSVRKALQMEEDGEVLKLARLRTIDGAPVGLHVAYLNTALLRGKTDLSIAENESLYSVLERDHGLKICDAQETIEALPADAYRSTLLEVPEGFPLLHLRRITYLESGEPVEYVKMWYRADRYRYSVKLRRNKQNN
ncbi:MAG: GntR family transcriptional regulator [Firmicutes bacterium]|nr:GntR family transcriptional regulator [Bacillota bacterium]